MRLLAVHGLSAHIATGPAVVSSPDEGVERLFAAHAHGHQLVSDQLGGTLAQLLPRNLHGEAQPELKHENVHKAWHAPERLLPC